MKHPLKRLAGLLLLTITAVAITGAFDPPKAEAQQYGISTLTATSNIPALTTNSLALTGNIITLTKYDSVGLMIQFNCTAAGNSNAVFTFKPSLDGTTNASSQAASQIQIIAPGNGTSTVTVVTNIPASAIGSVGYLILDNIGNQHGTVGLTNVIVQASTKPRRNG